MELGRLTCTNCNDHRNSRLLYQDGDGNIICGTCLEKLKPIENNNKII